MNLRGNIKPLDCRAVVTLGLWASGMEPSVSHCSKPSYGGCQTESPSYLSQPPKFWKGYVDDTCCALATSDIDGFHQHINSIEPHIQFTVEIETDGQLPFLDLLFEREEDSSIATSVYRKPTHIQIGFSSHTQIDFSSHHPQAHKAAVVCILVFKA